MVGVKDNTARKYAKRFPELSTKALAELMHFECKGEFKSYENARCGIRYQRGLMPKGRCKTNYITDPVPFHPYVPKSDAVSVRPTQLNAKGRGTIISDVHLPYHDKKAVELALQHAIENGHTDYLIILGDLADCYQESYFSRDPRLRRFPEEVEIVKSFLDEMTDIFSMVKYKFGNHERRHESYMRCNAPDLLGLPNMDLHEIFELGKKGVSYIPWNVVIQAGHLTLLHGHEYGRSFWSPVNPARGLYLRAKATAICGHYHQTSHHSESNIRGVVDSCWSLGCLCTLNPEYRPLNKWDHGFGLMEYDGEGDFEIQLKRIINGKVY